LHVAVKSRKEEIKFDPEVLERVERFAAKKEAAGEHWVIALSADEDWSNRSQSEQTDADRAT
jgi:hypothetical protein